MQKWGGGKGTLASSAASLVFLAMGALNARVRAQKEWPKLLEGLSNF